MPDETRDTDIVIVSEGGERYTNYPWDPGGPTKFGIAGRSHPGVDIAHLDRPGAEAIYHREYVVPLGYAQLADPLALHTLSAGVNLGPPATLRLVPARTFAAAVEAFDWAWLTRYRDITSRNVARVATRLKGQPAAAVYKAQRDEYAKLLGWLNRILNLRRDS